MVRSELDKRGFKDEAFERGSVFVEERKKRAVEFSQFCFHFHLNVPTGTSSDQLKRIRPFGVLPFLIQQSPEKSRFIFSFLCSNWRFIDGLKCSAYPDVCDRCDQENTSLHVLFSCPRFEHVRREFRSVSRMAFNLDAFGSVDRDVQNAICKAGRRIYEIILNACESADPE